MFTGKAELGQGLKTALLQIAAEQLDVAPGQIELVTADTARTPNEGFTAGSHSMQDSGTAIMNAAAQVRGLLLERGRRRVRRRRRHACRPTTDRSMRRMAAAIGYGAAGGEAEPARRGRSRTVR